ncbi:oxidoreductase [Mesorhizobium sp. NZP2298]|uniref:oxidoreductase n=1 Tax=Mesorhizobium sp. NZP2298 TaxID=2483403 RepID=UPI001552B1F0|nr:oxidoreductase [Mesorhizobium sp. NZP2298]QKC99154.1 oxidoreductase [Mesorhizobium sp. NZP2298]
MTPPVTDERVAATLAAYLANDKNQSATAKAEGISRESVQRHIRLAAERGMMGTKPVLDGFAIKSVSSKVDGHWVKQTKAAGEVHEIPEGFALKRDSALTDSEGRRIAGWRISEPSKEYLLAAMRAAVDALKEELPRATPTPAPGSTVAELLNLYAVTDAHFGMLSWREETGADYDLPIAEKLLLDWFAAAIDLAPPAQTAIFAQIGDLLHYDGFESKTPTSGHILDADSRLPKVIRVVIRTLRRVIKMLLEKHEFVHIIMADANHDPASEAWLREMFASFFEDEPRVTVDSSAGTYYAYEHGDVSIFVHHGHKRKIGNVDSVFAGKFREMYGKTKFSYAHLGHLHSDELKSTNLMKVERHETLAAPDAYAANGGWLSGRSAKVITYSKRHGEVARLTLTPGMVGGYRTSVNDNRKEEMAA